MTLRVRVDVPDRYKDRIQGLYDVQTRLADLGVAVTFSDVAGDEDVVFVQDSVELARRKSGAPSPVPMLVFERTASSVVSHYRSRRALLKAPETTHWIKEMTLRDPRINNAPMLDGRYHFALLEPESERIAPCETPLKRVDMIKISPLLPMFLQDRYAGVRDAPGGAWARRPIDVLCAGMVDYEFPTLTNHRRTALSLIAQHAPRYVCVSGQIVPKASYHELLRNTKIFVSPYGLGEYSFKDFEALFAGCLLVKADSSFITTYAFDIYRKGEYCLQVKPDMSDLPEMLERIASDPIGSRAMADKAGQALRSAFDPDAYAVRMAEAFREAAERRPPSAHSDDSFSSSPES